MTVSPAAGNTGRSSHCTILSATLPPASLACATCTLVWGLLTPCRCFGTRSRHPLLQSACTASPSPVRMRAVHTFSFPDAHALQPPSVHLHAHCPPAGTCAHRGRPGSSVVRQRNSGGTAAQASPPPACPCGRGHPCCSTSKEVGRGAGLRQSHPGRIPQREWQQSGGGSSSRVRCAPTPRQPAPAVEIHALAPQQALTAVIGQA